MPVNPGLTTTIPSGTPYYRITSLSFAATPPSDHVKVVNGAGARKSNEGGRYNHGGVLSVYLTEDIETCFAEKMYYFHQKVLKLMDNAHHWGGRIPPFQEKFILWEIEFEQDIPSVFDMSIPRAHGAFSIYPCMTLNPTQDYEHLKRKRMEIESEGYMGLRVSSSRTTNMGNMVVLFEDQSSNVRTIKPHEVEFRLMTPNGTPFINQASDELDFTSGEVRFTGALPPTGGAGYHTWRKLMFNH